MSTVTVNGNTYSSAGEAANDMRNGGHRTHLLPMLADAVIDLAAKVTAAQLAETNAETAETNAETAETNATTQAGNALTSANNAAASEAAAAAIANAFIGTSATSWTPAVESKAFTTQAGELYTAGIYVTVVSAAAPTAYGFGQVTSYAGTTLTVDVQLVGGTGAHTDWNISLAGVRGAQGAPGTGITADTVGWHGTGGTTPKTLTVDADFTASNIIIDLPTIRPSLLLDFANTANPDGSANLDPRITFTRTSTKTTFDCNGVMRTLAAGVGAAPFDPVTGKNKGFHIEEARTNLLTYSEQFDNAAWTKTDTTITANAVVAPDGTTTADKLVEDATTASHVVSEPVTYSATTYTATIYAKAAERIWLRSLIYDGTNSFSGYFNLSTGVVGSVTGTGTTSSIQSVGNGWYRCSITCAVSAGTGTFAPRLATDDGTSSYAGDGTSGLYVWGASLEQGSFSTSYIPTTTASVTRSADVASMTGTNFSDWYRQSAASVSATWTPSAVSGTRPVISIDDATANEAIILRGTTTNPELYVIDGAGNDTTLDAGTIAANTEYSIAAAITASDLSVSLDGATVATGSETMPTVTQARIGMDGTNYLNGSISRISVYPARLTNAVLQGVSSL